MARGINRLTVLQVNSATVGMHSDGGGLWLRVQPRGRAWLFRYHSPTTDSERRMGLGSTSNVSLKDARIAATAARAQLQIGHDPLDLRKAEVALKARDKITFRDAAVACIDAKQAGWRNAKHSAQWGATLEAYVYPAIGNRKVISIGKSDILKILTPIWQAKPETASRVRGRIETILDYAKQRDWRAGENPASWKGNLAHALAPRSKIAQVEHHAALPWKRLPEVMLRLAASTGMGALAVRFTALTAARSGEVRGATWSEFDLDEAIWTIPAGRMKAAREHRVPLTAAALAILRPLKQLSEFEVHVFSGGRRGKPLSDVALSQALHLAAGRGVTVHGLRSSFRDWVAEATTFQADVAEAALAHALGDAVRVAYQRGDLFEKRRAMMEEWGKFASG